MSWYNKLFPVLMFLVDMARKIAKIIKEKGPEEAGKMRLDQIEGWHEWSQEVLKEEAKSHFIDQLQKIKDERKING